jgi:hypothetical protein
MICLEPYDYRIWVLILLVTLHGVAIMVFLFEYFQKRLTYDDIRQVCYNSYRSFFSFPNNRN